MSEIRYMMATSAACASSYLDQALKHVGGLADELIKSAGALVARYGVISTGEQAGNIVLFQGYEALSGIESAFDVYGKSSDYQAIMSSGKVKVALRNILKMEALQLQNPSAEVPAYGVLTRWGSADLMLDRMRDIVPLFEENGAMIMRYSTIMTGSDVGRRLLGVGYPSMDAIEKTYDALRSSKDYKAMVGDIELDWRNIVKFVG